VSKKSGLRWSTRAIEDLVEISLFIAKDKPSVARAWCDKLRKRARDAAAMPRAGRRVLEDEPGELREVIHRGYRIVYRIEEKAIVVLRVLEGHRQFPGNLDIDEE
jgi:toxin ParE1/3/4